MGEIRIFQDLEVWREGHAFVLVVYSATEAYPVGERFGLVSQMRRAAVSITSNIAEGFSRFSYKDKIRFYSMAHSSLTELQNQLLISKDVRYLGVEQFGSLWNQSVTVQKLLNGLLRASRIRS